MRSEKNEDLCLRIGVKQGGCSGMSYTMEFESRGSANPDDSVIEYEGFTIGQTTWSAGTLTRQYILCACSLRPEEPSLHVWNGAGLQRRSHRGWLQLPEPERDEDVRVRQVVCDQQGNAEHRNCLQQLN
ncbi:hypothetical protein ACQJBY_071591 [Aegilops geniculata]